MQSTRKDLESDSSWKVPQPQGQFFFFCIVEHDLGFSNHSSTAVFYLEPAAYRETKGWGVGNFRCRLFISLHGSRPL